MINLIVLFIGLIAIGQTLLADWNASHVLFLMGQILAPFLLFSPLAFSFLRVFQKKHFCHTTAWAFSILVWSCLILLFGKLKLLNEQCVLGLWLATWIPEVYWRFQGTRLALKSISEFASSEMKGSLFNGPIWIGVTILLLNAWVLRGMRGSLFPPLDFDLSLFHLSVSKIYIEQESIINTWWLRGAFLLQLPHFLYTAGILFLNSMGFRGDLFPAFMSSFYFILSGIAVQEFVNRKGLFKYFIGLCLMFPVIRWNLSTAYLDVLNSYLILITCLSMLLYYRHLKTFYLWCTLLFAEMAFLAKYFAGILLFPIFVVGLGTFVYQNRNSIDVFKKFSIQTLYFIPPAVGILFYFGWQNFETSGNPIFPFLLPFNPENQYYWGLDDIQQFSAAISHWSDRIDLRHHFSIVFELPTLALKLSDTPEFNISILWIALVLVSITSAIIHYRKSKVPVILVLIGLSMLYGWMISSPVIRYLQPAITILVVSLVYGIAQYQRQWIRGFFMFLLIFIFTLDTGPLAWTNFQRPPIKKEEVHTYLKTHKLGIATAEYFQDHTKPMTVVYTMFMEDLWLYFPRPFIGDWFGLNNYGWLLEFTEASQFSKFFAERDVEFFIVHSEALKGTHKPNVAQLFGSYLPCLKKVFEEGPVQTFRIDRKQESCFDRKAPPLPMILELKENAAKELMPFWPRKF